MDKVGRYRIERRLGAGSFATVWLGHDDDLDVPVAVKVLAENWADNADVRSRFLAEARIMRRIRDPRLVQVYDIGTLEDGRPYFVMDYIDGGSLNELRKTKIGPIQALQLCADACRALDVLHEHDIIHRDVTPGNLLLSSAPNGRTRVLVADLGVAKSMVDAVGATMTAGTPAYMAPEQAAGELQLDRRADIYSLTAVTYAMLAGGPPFAVKSIGDILARQPDQPPAPLAERIGAPPSLDAVMLSGLATDRNRRPPTALLLADALDTLAAQMQDATTVLPGSEPAGSQSAGSQSAGLQSAGLQSAGSKTTRPRPAAVPKAAAAPPPPARTSPTSNTPQPARSVRPEPAPAPTRLPEVSPPAGSTGYPTVGPQLQPSPQYTEPQYGEPVPQPYSVVAPAPLEKRRVATSSYVLLALAALALFALSMFITIVALN